MRSSIATSGAMMSLWPMGLATAIVALGLGARAPLARYDMLSVERIQDVARNHHWLLIHDQYPEHFRTMALDSFGAISRKPPLFYWLSAIAVNISGGAVNRFNVRVVSIVAGAAIALTVLAWTAAQLGMTQGWLAFFFLLGSDLFASRATIVLTDMLMTALLFGAWCTLYPLFDDQPARDRASPMRIAAAGVLLGLGILTKGPIVLVVAALGGLIYLAMLRRNPLATLTRGWPWAVLAISVAIAALWFVPALLAGGPDLSRVFVAENLGHLMPGSLGGIGESQRPTWFIVARLLGGMAPASFLVPALGAALIGRSFSEREHKPVMFQLGLLSAVVLIFSLGASKRTAYALPAVAPLAILFAALFGGISTQKRLSRVAIALRNATVAIVGVIALAAPILILSFAESVRMARELRSLLTGWEVVYLQWALARLQRLDPGFALFAAGGLLGGIVIFVSLWRRRATLAGAGFALIALSTTTMWTGAVKPLHLDRQSLHDFVIAVRHRADDHPVYLARGYYDREVAFYYGRYLPLLNRNARGLLKHGHSVYVVIEPRRAHGRARHMGASARELLRAPDLIGHSPPALFQFRPNDKTPEGRSRESDGAADPGRN